MKNTFWILFTTVLIALAALLGACAAIYVSWRDPQNPGASKQLSMYWAFADSVGINTA